MIEKRYKIHLKVPLGLRNGTMVIRESNGKAEGRLEVMNGKTEFFGELSADGSLTI